MMIKHLCLAATLLLAALPGRADPTNPPQIAPSAVADTLDAIARLRPARATTGGCSAVLISPTEALTAAHCAGGATAGGNRLMLTFRPTGQIGEILRVPVVRVTRHPDHAPGALSTETAHADLALLDIGPPIPADRVTPIPVATEPMPETGAIYGFINPGNGPLHGHETCRARNIREALIASDCHVVSGISGAPLLSGGPGTWRVEGIAVARINSNGVRALIADVAPWTGFGEGE